MCQSSAIALISATAIPVASCMRMMNTAPSGRRRCRHKLTTGGSQSNTRASAASFFKPRIPRRWSRRVCIFSDHSGVVGRQEPMANILQCGKLKQSMAISTAPPIKISWSFLAVTVLNQIFSKNARKIHAHLNSRNAPISQVKPQINRLASLPEFNWDRWRGRYE